MGDSNKEDKSQVIIDETDNNSDSDDGIKDNNEDQ